MCPNTSAFLPSYLQEASLNLASGNSAIIRAGDAADEGAGLSLDVVPYLLDNFEQVTTAVAPLKKRAERLREFSLEVTATHEVRVHNWQGAGAVVAREEIELTVQASGLGAVTAEGGEVLDIVIDLDSGLGEALGAAGPGDEERITIELELQVDSAEDLDITVDIARAVTEVATARCCRAPMRRCYGLCLAPIAPASVVGPQGCGRAVS